MECYFDCRKNRIKKSSNQYQLILFVSKTLKSTLFTEKMYFLKVCISYEKKFQCFIEKNYIINKINNQISKSFMFKWQPNIEKENMHLWCIDKFSRFI